MAPRREQSSLRRLVLVGDVVLVVAALALAAGLHAALRTRYGMFKVPPRFDEYAMIVYLSVPLWLSLMAVFGLHRVFERTWTRFELFIDLLKVHVAGFIALSSALFFTQTTINRSLVAMFLGCSLLLTYASRSVLGMWQRYQHDRGQMRTRLLLVGAAADVKRFADDTSIASLPPTIVGVLGPDSAENLRHLGALADIERILHDEPLDQVLFFPPYHQPAEVAEALRACEVVGVPAGFAIPMVQPTDAPPQIVERFDRPFMSFDAAPKSAERLAIKHAFDWVASLLGVLVLSPLLLVVCVLILLTMGRPIFFLQSRAGLHGRQFRMIKFRTMVQDAESKRDSLLDKNEMTGPVFKVTTDPRVTRLGHVLRKTSIDELPQLFNVLAGSMSLVGPRPLPIKEQQQIRGWHRRRLSMKPGITCIWQISGRSGIDFEEWMRLDERYIREWSLRLDLKILFKTLPAVLFARGAK
jgi:exopolysaccharide biosynthesis polyprenyl glycosylphosphotransferase